MSALLSFSAFANAAKAGRPTAAIILGSGMNGLARRLQPWQALPFVDVPGLEATTVAGHAGQLTLGEWAGKCVLLFEGRQHYYECQDWRRVVAPVQAAHFLGARVLFLTNAAGGIHDALTPGSLMALRQHIQWNRPHCWRQEAETGSPYSPRLRRLLLETAAEQNIGLHEGTYAAVTGPSYETPAEIRALRAWGADAVGMSTAREVQTAHASGMECAALSLITNRAAGLSQGPIHHDEVLTCAATVAERLGRLIEGFLRKL